MTTIDKDAVAAIAADFDNRPEMLVQILVSVVHRCGWVPEDAIRQLADILNLSRADVHGVVEFYHDFRTEPPGRHIVKVCEAEACQSVGGRQLATHVRATVDDDVTVEPVYCLGNCAAGPAVMINEKTHGRVSPERFDTLMAALAEADS